MQLNIQRYLSNGGTYEQLEKTTGVEAYKHPSLPLVGFRYSQIDSPKTNPIVKEARGIILEERTWKVVAKPFNRFFNLGEDLDAYKNFNWSNFSAYSKEDGSLIIVYNYEGTWYAATGGSFGFVKIFYQRAGKKIHLDKTFPELFWSIFTPQAELDPNNTYLFELCTEHNKVIRTYKDPQVFLLSVVNRNTLKELTDDEVDKIAIEIGSDRPKRYPLFSQKDVLQFIREQEDKDPTWEGLIIKDANGIRIKVKTKTYTSLSALHDNGNITNPKKLVPFVLNKDPAELLLHFPEVSDLYFKVKKEVDDCWEKLKNAWEDYHTIEDQKKFALAIKDVPFKNLLFSLRKMKYTDEQTIDDLKKLWRESTDNIIKELYE